MSQDRLEEAFAPLRERTAPEALRTRPLGTRRTRYRPVFMVAAAATGLAAVVVAMWPRPASAASLLEQAGRAFTGHAVIFTIQKNGSRTQIGQGWYAPGRSRLEFKRGNAPMYVRVYQGAEQREMIWDPETSRITLRTGVKEDRVTVMPSQIDPQALALLAKDLKPNHRFKLEPATFEGKAAQRLDIVFPDRTIRLYGNAQDLRLMGYETDFKHPDGRTQTERVLLSPGTPSEKDLTAKVSYNGRTFDPFEERERIRKSMEIPLTVDQVDGKEVAIRRVAMNSRHDLFVLYTGVFGKYGENYVPTQIRDDVGGKYMRMPGFSPHGNGFPNGIPYVYDRKPLEGMHFMREGKGTPTQVSIGFRKEFGSGEAFRREFKVNIAPSPLLDFFPFMILSPLNERDLQETEAFMKLHRANTSKKWAEAERWARRLNELEAEKEPYQDRRYARGYVRLAAALARQGKRKEAVAAIREARKRFVEISEPGLERELLAWERQLGVR